MSFLIHNVDANQFIVMPVKNALFVYQPTNTSVRECENTASRALSIGSNESQNLEGGDQEGNVLWLSKLSHMREYTTWQSAVLMRMFSLTVSFNEQGEPSHF